MKYLYLFLFTLATLHSCGQQKTSDIKKEVNMNSTNKQSDKLEIVTLGAGCFWCVEAIFQQLNGVVSAVSGYSGGHVKNPSYKEVCTGTTGHAEVCQISYDPDVISFEEILEVYWQTHDPTTLNRQGNDIGTQYRSVIFYHNNKQKEIAEVLKMNLEKAKIWDNPIVTEIVPFSKFYKAEDYHQEYYDNNPNQSYCTIVITPKIEKFRKVFSDKLK
ncbi:MAG: peptide-methionine (S)-S-oxide reductase MsrA [Bacteroidales bacterium]|nr:peptide-methionine (S)-S-oxide reductase MsrA [Bacteroidales bacterium]